MSESSLKIPPKSIVIWLTECRVSNTEVHSDLQRFQMSVEMLKVVDSLIKWFEDQIQMYISEFLSSQHTTDVSFSLWLTEFRVPNPEVQFSL